jgi:hypothetical protein
VATIRLCCGWKAGLPSLGKACERLLGERRAIELDLADVSFMDPDGIQLISKLALRGISLGECAPFVEEQLKGA